MYRMHINQRIARLALTWLSATLALALIGIAPLAYAQDAASNMVIKDGAAQPVFSFTDPTSEGYSNANSEIWHFAVYVESDYDTDLDGKRDLVKAFVQVPRAAVEGKYQAPVVYEASPYVAGFRNDSIFSYANSSIDETELMGKPDARVPTAEVSSYDFALSAEGFELSDWSYELSMRPVIVNNDMLDYYLVRGFAVVQAAGLGTYGSEGLECYGSVMERDAMASVVEWLHGDRVAYTNATGTTQIKATDWSSGKVGMIGLSYSAAMCYEVATTGVEGLETIIPASGPTCCYERRNSQGICIADGGNYNYTTQLADLCSSRLFPRDNPELLDLYQRYRVFLRDSQTALKGDYGEYWQKRDWYTNQTELKASALVVMGLNDYNVRSKQVDLMRSALVRAGCETRMLMHQNGHVYPATGNTDILIGNHSFMEWTNLWFTRALCGVENDASTLPDITVQSNVDGSFSGTDRWDESDCVTIRPSSSGETTVETNGKEGDTSGDSSAQVDNNNSAIWTLTVEEPFTIAGKIPVHLHIKVSNLSEGEMPLQAVLVDTATEPFPAFCVKGEPEHEVISKGDGSPWSYDLVRWVPETTTEKTLAQGQMDMRQPEAGYEPATATTREEPIDAGTYYDYTLYLDPTYYTVGAGHTLKLYVQPTYGSGIRDPLTEQEFTPYIRYGIDYSSQMKIVRDYNFTILNDKSYATLPIAEEVSYTLMSGDDASWEKGSSDKLAFTWSRSLNDSEAAFHFESLLVDGVVVDPANYDHAAGESGGLTVELDAALLQTLRTGEHSVAASFDDGGEVAAATLRITAASESDGSGGSADRSDDHKGISQMWRLYNPASGEHFYTASVGERDLVVAAGWRNEGMAWLAPASSATPVFRLYNPNGGDHHYTTSASERDLLVAAGWRDEGIGWYSEDAKTVAVWRQYNPNAKTGAHNFTASTGERDLLVAVGWRDEGIGWYGVRG